MARTYSESETALLKQARELKDLVDHPSWRVFQKMLVAQFEARMGILATPLHALQSEEFKGMDFTSKAMQVESIKGAIIGLRLAHDLPQLTITQASDLVRE